MFCVWNLPLFDWKHTHDLTEFLGANILDDEPFIVMPLIANGNIREYINNNPSCDRLKFVSLLCYIPAPNVHSPLLDNRSNKLPLGWSTCIPNISFMVTWKALTSLLMMARKRFFPTSAYLESRRMSTVVPREKQLPSSVVHTGWLLNFLKEKIYDFHAMYTLLRWRCMRYGLIKLWKIYG